MRELVAAVLAAGLCACGGDDGVDPAIITGGGIHDPGIDGTVNVFVVDEDTDAPIAGAKVRVGKMDGTTDSTGLFTAKSDSLSGKQTIAAVASGHVPTLWVGVDGANVTIPLTRTGQATGAPPQALLSGTVTGWASLPAPATGHLLAALVEASAARDLGDDQGTIEQPPPVNNLPANACVRGPGAQVPPCEWRVNARAGTIALMATLVDIDTRGTADSSDDTRTTIGFALEQPLTVVDGVAQTGLALDQVAGTPTTANVGFGSPPAGLPQVLGIVGLDLGDAGVVRSFLQAATPTASTVVVPSLSGVPGASYELLGVAQEMTMDEATRGSSLVLRRGLTSAAGLTAGDWLPPPAGLAFDRTTLSVAPVAGADVSIVEIDTSSGSGSSTRAMSVAIFDGTTTIALPVDLAPLPSGSLTVRASGFDADGFRPNDFEVETLLDAVTRLAGEGIVVN